MSKLIIPVTLVALITSGLAQAGCVAPRDRSTTPNDVFKQFQVCINDVYNTGLQENNEVLMTLAKEALLMKDHVRLAYHQGQDRAIFSLGRNEGVLYTNIAKLADDMVSAKTSPGDAEAVISQMKTVIRGLPLRGFDPKLRGYGPTMVSGDEKKGPVEVSVDTSQLGKTTPKLKDPATGVTYAETRKEGDNSIFSLPAELFANLTEEIQSTSLILEVPARRSKHDFGLLFAIPIPKLGSYEIVYTTETTKTQQEVTSHDLGRFESTLMRVQEEKREVCARNGWKIDHSKGHKLTTHSSRYGEIKSVYKINDRCIGVNLWAQPHGRAFGNDKAKKGFVEASVSFTEIRNIRSVSPKTKLSGKLSWGMNETISVPAPLATLSARMTYFDKSSSTLNLKESKDKRVSIDAKRGATEFTLTAKSPGN